MGTAYLPITITAQEGPVTLFECDCVAEVEYQTDRANELDSWHVSNLRFDQSKNLWDDTDKVWIRTIVRSAWASKQLFNVLLPYISTRALEDQLTEHLLAAGEIGFSGAAMRADYNASVL